MPDQQKSVFVSMGNPYREEYESVLTRLMDLLQEAGLRPRVINKTDYPIGRPLEHISSVMSECSGTIIVAFERNFFPNGKEKRSSKGEKDLLERRYTTPWNHIEAALAYKQGLPILVLAEEGVQQEGLIEEGHDWYVERFNLADDPLTSRHVRARLQEWARAVREGRLAVKVSTPVSGEMKIKDLVSSLSLKSVWTVITSLSIASSAVFSAGLAVGKYLQSK